MLPIFICEDDARQREKIEKIIADFILIEDLDMSIRVVTENPLEVLDYLESHDKAMGLYFLDVDLGHEMNGISLGAQIRKIDPLGKIVFVTTHGEMSYMTFLYKVEALDYIIKDHPDGIDERVRDCIRIAHANYLSDANPERKVFKVKVEDRVMMVEQDDIMFISSSDVPHMLTLHFDNSHIDFPGSLKEIEALLPDFYRSHKSYLVNPANVKEINKGANEVEMVNEEIALVSVRKMKGLLALV